jgi:hypothetical protein
MTAKPPNMTTDAGISVASDEYSLTVGPAGPNLLRALGTCSFPIRSPERLLAPVATISEARRAQPRRGRAARPGHRPADRAFGRP